MSNITLEQTITMILESKQEDNAMDAKSFLLELDYKQIEKHSTPKAEIRKAMVRYGAVTKRLKQTDDPLEIQKSLGEMIDQLMICVLFLYNKNLK